MDNYQLKSLEPLKNTYFKNLDKKIPFVVTGASGFLGSNVIYALAEMGYEGYAVDKYKPNQSLLHMRKVKNFLFCNADLSKKSDTENLKRKLPKKFYFLHLASPNTERNEKINKKNKINFMNYSLQSELEIVIAENIINLIKGRLVAFIYTSSIEVYGLNNQESLLSEQTLPSPDSPYGFGKLFSENMFRNEIKNFDAPLTILRLPQIYGDFEYLFYSRLIPNFIKSGFHNVPIKIFGNLKDYRHYLHCNDILMPILTALDKRDNDTYVLAGEKVHIQDIINQISKALNKHLKLIYETKNVHGEYKYEFDLTKAKRQLEFNQKIDLETGINSSIETYRIAQNV
jgi:nucleoside-diphosphate-sugar epimerase